MDLKFNTSLAHNYSSQSQKIRVMTEAWVSKSIFCPNCGNSSIDHYPSNRPVADFFCADCDEIYELKSKKGNTGNKVVDGAYSTMIERLQSADNPSFFFLNYSLSDFSVRNFMVIPKHFFVPSMIEKRKPLSPTARRAGWVGCNILLQNIPQTGKIFYVQNGEKVPRNRVLLEWKKTLFLHDEKATSKGWTLDIMRCIEKLKKDRFSLDDIYNFELELSRLHPENNHVKAKIRQQLQLLRDKGYLDFSARGEYRLT